MNNKNTDPSTQWIPIPSQKAPEVDELIKNLTGFDRIAAITTKTCTFCKTPVTLDSFKDKLSFKEYHISGMCQKCQNEMFGK